MKFNLYFTGRESRAIGRSYPIQTTRETDFDLTKLSQHDLYRHPDCFFLWEKWENIMDLRAEKIEE